MLYVIVQPNARNDAFHGHRDGFPVIRVAAPPTDGRANRRLTEFIAGSFGVPKGRVTLERGATGRRKCLRIREPACWPVDLAPTGDIELYQSLPEGK